MYQRQVLEENKLNEERDLVIHNYRMYQIDGKDIPESERTMWKTANPRVFKSNSLLKPLTFQFSTELNQKFQTIYSMAAGLRSSTSVLGRGSVGAGGTSRIWGQMDTPQPSEISELASQGSRLEYENDLAQQNYQRIVDAWMCPVTDTAMQDFEAEINPLVQRELPPLDAPDVTEIRGKLDSGMIEKNLPIYIYDDKTQYGTRLPYAHLKAINVLPEQKDLVEEYMTKRRTDYLTQGGRARGHD